MQPFTSPRERNLWIWAFFVLAAIYVSIFIARPVTDFLRDRAMLTPLFFLGLFLVIAAIGAYSVRLRPGGLEIAIGLGVAAVYLLLFLRMEIVEERGHLVEYSVLALLLHLALAERRSNGGLSVSPPFLAFGAAVLLGLLDETIQVFLPDRFFDWRDVLFNSLAAFIAVTAGVLLAWARRRFGSDSHMGR
jgi:hypothetical protein